MPLPPIATRVTTMLDAKGVEYRIRRHAADAIPVEEGYVRLPDAPGIGFEEKANLWAVMRELAV